mmetsp:Transcript_18408/g.21272  ORF Transcript_18408/g.21272 Transcript_18408/m.21272 type:complete len:126 (+) Transcript_18408:234-611(+)
MLLQPSLEPKVGFDNVTPRLQINRLLQESDTFQRLNAAHLNQLESLPIFIAAMILGKYAEIEETRLSKLATLWIILRNLYSVVYVVQNKPLSWVRSVLFIWSLSISCNLIREAAAKLQQKKSTKE